MKPSNHDINHAIENLPENIKQAIIEFNWAQEVTTIAREHHMQIDDAEVFRQETLLVILGKESADAYQANLADKLGIDQTKAATLVAEANQRIFLELQRRAFRTENNETEDDEPAPKKESGDPYLEPISGEDMHGIMAKEGVHLLGDETPQSIDSDLQREIDTLDADIQETVENHNKSALHSYKNAEFAEHTENSYQEPVDESDLRGIKQHEVDTSILKTKDQLNPEQTLENTEAQKPDSEASPRQSQGRDLGQGNHSLDQAILEHHHISRGDTTDLSPSQQEQVKEEGNFLEHLKGGTSPTKTS